MRACARSGALLVAVMVVTGAAPVHAQSATPAATPAPSNPPATTATTTPVAAPAAPDVRARCVAEHEQAQISKMHEALVSARASALSCSQAECPGLLRTDCAGWFADLDRQVPSVVISVREGSNDLASATVSIDGKPFPQALSGDPVELDPGHHTFEVALPGKPKLTREVVLASGEKARPLVFELPTEAQPASAQTQPAAAPPAPTHRPVPVVTWVLAGTTVAAVAGGSVFGALALSKRSDLEKKPQAGGCAPYCSNSQVAPVHHLSLTADLFFGAAAVTGVGTIVTYLLRPEKPLQVGGLSLDFGLAPGSASLGVRGDL